VRVDCHLVLVLPEMLDRISCPTRHHKLLGGSDEKLFLSRVVSRRFSGRKAPPLSGVVDMPSRSASGQSLQCPQCKGPSDFCAARMLGVLVITQDVRFGVPPIALVPPATINLPFEVAAAAWIRFSLMGPFPFGKTF